MAGKAPTRQSQRIRKGQKPYTDAPNEKETAASHTIRGGTALRCGGRAIRAGRGHGAPTPTPTTPSQPPPPPPHKKRPALASTNPFELRPKQAREGFLACLVEIKPHKNFYQVLFR